MCSPRTAASATFALKAEEWLRRFLLVIFCSSSVEDHKREDFTDLARIFVQPLGSSSVYYRLDHSLRPGQPTNQEGSSWVTTTWPITCVTNNLNLQLHHTHPYNYTGSLDSSRLLLPIAIAGIQENRADALSDLECALSYFLGRLATKKHHGRTEVQLSLRAWLNDHFGILTSVGQEATKTVKQVSDRLCRLVSRSLIADAVTLYRYDYGSCELVTQGWFYIGPQKEDWEKTMDQLMI